VLVSGFYLGSLYVFVLAGMAFSAHRSIIRDWTPVQARLVSSSMYWDVSRRWGRTPILITGIEHRLERVDNHQVGIARLPAGRPNRRGTTPQLKSSLQSLPPGSIISVRQNPNDPAQMSLITGYDLKSFQDVVLMCVLAIGLFGFAVWIGRTLSMIQERVPETISTTGMGTPA
jgi:hypothetical protein